MIEETEGIPEVSRRVLAIAQSAFPICERPYEAIAKQLDITEFAAYSCIKDLMHRRILRRVGAIFSSYRLGYASTLCALAVPEAQAERTARFICTYPGVTHCDKRDDHYNIWFTLIARDPAVLQGILDEILEFAGTDDCLDLPATMLFKLREDFNLSDDVDDGIDFAPIDPVQIDPYAMNATDRVLVRALQENLRETLTPFIDVAEYVHLSPTEIISTVQYWKDNHVIRRFGAIVRYQRLGFDHEALYLWSIPAADVLLAGEIITGQTEVSHCYERKTAPGWPYNLYARVHGRSAEECELVARDILKKFAYVGIKAKPARVLHSVEEYKKAPMKYFI